LNEVSLNMLPSLDLLDANTLAEAACSGLGVILGRFTQVAPLLREKKLCLLSENWVKAPRSHYLVRLEKRDPHPVFEIFRQWLHEEVRADDANVSAS
jgi:LysR family glycine cleavage system transcriptional activator